MKLLLLLPTAFATTCDFKNDNCGFKFDGECDADGFLCSENSDCLDCDPCQVHSSCDDCISAEGCTFCSGTGNFCASTELFSAFPTLCAQFDGEAVQSCENVSQPPIPTAPTCEIATDTCPTSFNAVCDADGVRCPRNSDCFDCDPCLAITTDGCSGCTSTEGCKWCGTSETNGLCTSEAYARNTVCEGLFGVPYVYSTDCGAIPEPGKPLEPGACDIENDQCLLRYNGVCNVGEMLCPAGDCFDCDPCQAHRFDGCDACTSSGCLWCGSDAVCVSPGNLPVDGSILNTLSCKAADFSDTCPSNPAKTDPLYEANLWRVDLINLQEAWDAGYTGKGVGIRINDNGVDWSHPEFDGKFDKESSCDLFTPPRKGKKHNHGTACASIAAGNANATCSVGVAPLATISSCRIISMDRGDDVELDKEAIFSERMEKMDISSNSWGTRSCRLNVDGSDLGFRRRLQDASCPFDETGFLTPCRSASPCALEDWGRPIPLASRCDEDIARYCSLSFLEDQEACELYLDLYVRCSYNALGEDTTAGLLKGISTGRGGKGIVYVFASGNDFQEGADTNFSGLRNSRYTITVGAVDKDGNHASYSTGGSALFVVAPGGDRDHYTNSVVALQASDGKCTAIGPGTSFAVPTVSGVIALMLEARPDLTWRDVQGVIASSSAHPNGSSTTINGAGFKHSYKFGFGIVDAGAAVKLAETWKLYGKELSASKTSTTPLEIPEFGDGEAVSIMEIKTDDLPVESFVLEAVVVYLDLSHGSRGDLEIELVAPSGTSSILIPGLRPENSQLSEDERWKLMTVRNWGESAVGTWELKFQDEKLGDLTSCVDKAGYVLELTDDELEDPLELTCSVFERLEVCGDGGKGARFDEFFPFVPLGPKSTIFAAEDGTTAGEACCACGGGIPVDSVEDVLRGWKIVLYGHDELAVAAPRPSIPDEIAVAHESATATMAQPTVSPTSVKTSAPVVVKPSVAPTDSPEMPAEASIGELLDGIGVIEKFPTPSPAPLVREVEDKSTASSSSIGPMLRLVWSVYIVFII